MQRVNFIKQSVQEEEGQGHSKEATKNKNYQMLKCK